MRWSGYVKRQEQTGPCGSPRSHHVDDLDRLRSAYLALQREASAGVDGETWRHYGETLEANLGDLSERLQRGAYRAKPVRRVFIPKTDGGSDRSVSPR